MESRKGLQVVPQGKSSGSQARVPSDGLKSGQPKARALGPRAFILDYIRP